VAKRFEGEPEDDFRCVYMSGMLRLGLELAIKGLGIGIVPGGLVNVPDSLRVQVRYCDFAQKFNDILLSIVVGYVNGCILYPAFTTYYDRSETRTSLVD